MITEDSRLEEFRQSRKKIRGSKEYLIVGIDVAKEKHNAFFDPPFKSDGPLPYAL
jgi:transposase